MIRLISILFIVFLSTALFAQGPDTLWTKTIKGSGDDWANSIQQTTDGGYVIVGTTHYPESVDRDVWLIKTDANGDTLWTKLFGGSDWDEGKSVQETRDGGYIIVGHTRSFGAGGDDVWLIKTDSNGDSLWTRFFGGSYYDVGRSVQQTFDDGYIITGYTESSNSGTNADLWLIKTDAGGDTMWTKSFGGIYGDEGNSVHQTTDGGYIITGLTNRIFFQISYQSELWLIKTDANGDTLWTRSFIGSSGVDEGYSVQRTVDGGYIAVGGKNIPYGGWYLRGGTNMSLPVESGIDTDVWLIKTDANGDTLWTKAFGDSLINIGYGVKPTLDGEYIITGVKQQPVGTYDVLLLKTDVNGKIIWSKTFGDSLNDVGNSVQPTGDGGYVVAGSFESIGGDGYDADAWLIKVAPDITSIDQSSNEFINGYQLQQNYPNPFNPTTTINYQLLVGSGIELTIFNMLGQQIRTIVNTHQPAGAHYVQWDGNDELGKPATSGIYFYRLKTGSFSETKKMVLMR